MKKALIAVLASLALSAGAQVAVYKFIETGTVTGDFQTYKVSYKGFIVWELTTGNFYGALVFLNGAYSTLDVSKYQMERIRSKTAQYTAFSAATTGSDSGGNPTMGASWFKGVNVSVNIGSTNLLDPGALNKWSIPKTFKLTERVTYWKDGEQQVEEDTGILAFDANDSPQCNLFKDDGPTVLHRTLLDNGYAIEAP